MLVEGKVDKFREELDEIICKIRQLQRNIDGMKELVCYILRGQDQEFDDSQVYEEEINILVVVLVWCLYILMV